MGSSFQCIKAIKRETTEDLARKFDRFDFRINENDEFTLVQRAKRELAGNGAPDEFIAMIYEGFRVFMIKTACTILANKTEGETDFIGPYTAAPLIDEMWCLAILYSEKYMELCQILVGGYIHRKPPDSLKGIKMVRLIWEDYTSKFWRLDSKYTVWIYNRDLKEMLESTYYKLMGYNTQGKIIISSSNLEDEVKYLRIILEIKVLNINLTRPNMIIPNSHIYFNSNTNDSVENIFNKIKSQLPLNLPKIVKRKYCTNKMISNYINEYVRFMTMLYFTNDPLTPSEEVDQVWHTHQCMTIEYKNFCSTIFNKFIYHTPTVGGESESTKHVNLYDITIEFYCFLFKESPPIGLWPTTADRFNPDNFLGSWFSLARIYQSKCKKQVN
ncbi:hypothetical protein SteCoe_38520 [Stentor coeruleus]|uniref:Uncharacterized protein n=1 Tax=Stentor coeruleus TaxID=5963 RepID=A0A1R2ALA8_9CILI|nr:hypothetical protein SteCoe_38520 [Stentor coeruleus]